MEHLVNERNQAELNKKLVGEFLQKVVGDLDFKSIPSYIAEDYIQHNPMVADGRQAFTDFATIAFKDLPKSKVDIKRMIAEGDLVSVHTKGNFNGKDVSIMDIFRIENNMIAEHWDVIQEVPEQSANDHPMF